MSQANPLLGFLQGATATPTVKAKPRSVAPRAKASPVNYNLATRPPAAHARAVARGSYPRSTAVPAHRAEALHRATPIGSPVRSGLAKRVTSTSYGIGTSGSGPMLGGGNNRLTRRVKLVRASTPLNTAQAQY